MEEQRKIVRYETVAAKDLNDFDRVVMYAINRGWHPYGNPLLDANGRMVQVVVNYQPWSVEVALKKFKHDSPSSQNVVDPANAWKSAGLVDGVLDNENVVPAAHA